jgi:hypothetical protein
VTFIFPPNFFASSNPSNNFDIFLLKKLVALSSIVPNLAACRGSPSLYQNAHPSYFDLGAGLPDGIFSNKKSQFG